MGKNIKYIFIVILLLTLASIVPLPSKDKSDVISELPEGEETIKGFPEFPVYPGATLDSSAQLPEERNGFEATWQVSGTVPEVMDWYVTTLSDGAWAIENFPPDPGALGQQMITAHEDEWRVWLVVNQEDEGLPIKIKAELTTLNEFGD
jgi:hypothetical protein